MASYGSLTDIFV